MMVYACSRVSVLECRFVAFLNRSEVFLLIIFMYSMSQQMFNHSFERITVLINRDNVIS